MVKSLQCLMCSCFEFTHTRRQNLALWLTTQLFFHDVQENDVDYMTSWVVSDNLSSLGLQDKIADEARQKHGMPAPELLSNFRCVGQTINELLEKLSHRVEIVEDVDPEVALAKKEEIKEEINNDDEDVEDVEQITLGDMDCEIKQISSASEELDLVNSMHGNSQFYPTDIDTLLKSQFHLGTFVVVEKKTNTVIGGIHAWNSGAIRITTLRDSDFRADDAALLHNPFWNRDLPFDVAEQLSDGLTSHVALRMRKNGYKFLYCFFPEEYPTVSKISQKAAVNVPWRARIWYVTNQTRVTVSEKNTIFYDPRQCLI